MNLNSARSRLLDQTVLVVVMLFAPATIVRADGGVVLWQQSTGAIIVTAFTTQSPLQTGPADISFLVEKTKQSRPILNARVFVVLEDESGVMLRAEATHSQARNKLLYCSVMNLAKPGRWRMKVIVTDDGEKYDLVNEFDVSQAQLSFIAHWKLLALPFTIAILFLFHQRLTWREKTFPSQIKEVGWLEMYW